MLNRTKVYQILAAIAMLSGIACGTTARQSAPKTEDRPGIVIVGSETLGPLAQRLAEEWMQNNPDVTVSVGAGGSGRGVKAVLDEVATIGLVSSPSEVVEASIPKGKPKVTILRISRDAVVPITNESNPVKNLALVQLRGVFSGEIRNWQELGGTDSTIDVLTQDDSSGTYETWKERVMGDKRVIMPSARVMSTSAMIREVQQNPNAIGYVAYSSSGSAHAISVDGISANVDTITQETFPVVRSLKFVTLPNVSEETQRFIDFCFDPQHGGRIQLDLGMIPYSARDNSNK
ncbi:MAG: phosphate ABC transporter substrate-binding protein [Polyangiaceae bacterium]|nr:phosphate ABC transporter substrate-binding protein [Polyangiaceae bacterium]